MILYSPKHTATLPELSEEHVAKLVDLWTERFIALCADDKIKYVFIFENRGEVVGVTMPHPHGQIYGYPFIPKKIQLELEAFREYSEKNGECLMCRFLEEEMRFEKRIIFETKTSSQYCHSLWNTPMACTSFPKITSKTSHK